VTCKAIMAKKGGGGGHDRMWVARCGRSNSGVAGVRGADRWVPAASETKGGDRWASERFKLIQNFPNSTQT
jgi:hypothetical protein